MGDYEEKQRKDREALDAKFRAASEPLADTIAAEILKATGLKVQRSTHEGSYAISLRLDEPRVEVEIAHDWGAGRYHYSRLPLGTPKIGLNTGRYSYGGKSWYRPAKDGSFNIAKIVERVKEAAERTTRQKEYEAAAKKAAAENAAAYNKELAGIKLPKGSAASRHPETGSYSLKFAGTFENLKPHEVEALAESLQKLMKAFEFSPSWRSELF
jgi:hypothetical protein